MKKDSYPFNLNNKNIVITGASSGIGRQCAIFCSQMGASVVLLGRDKERLKDTTKYMKNATRHLVYSIDLLEYEEVPEIVKNIVEQNGRINGLVNCAGISTTIPLNAISPKMMNHYFSTNVIGALNLTKHVVKKVYFSDEGGSIIFITSVMGLAGENAKSLYSMTKGALTAAVKSLAIELASNKVRVNAIAPGVVLTPMSQNSVYSRNEDSLKRIEELHPLGLGRTEDIANACVFLLSEAARWITGTSLIVDGGYLAR